MAITHPTIKAPGQTLAAVADWNANHAGTAAPDQHANEAHNPDMAEKSVYDAHDHSVGDPAQVSHADLTNVSADQHHAKQHAITSGADHTSAATPGKVLQADANGLPVDATNTDAQVSGAVAASHARAHAVDSANDHSAGTQGDILYAGAAGAWAKLAAGAAGKFLKTQGAAADPIWDTPVAGKGINAIAVFESSQAANFTTNSGAYVDVTGATFDITITKTCTIIVLARYLHKTATNATNNYVAIMIGGTRRGNNMSSMNTSPEWVGDMIGCYKTGVGAGVITCKLQASVGGAAGLMTLQNTTPDYAGAAGIHMIAIAIEE